MPQGAETDLPDGAAGPPADEPVEIGGFKLLERIGRGGMGSVYRARQLSMDRIVAVKILSQRLANNQDYVERFTREARAAAKLNHPYIVQGIDVGSSGGHHYFAMEYVNGETVAERLKRSGPLPEREAVAICAQVARALHHAHSRANIIHRDVKPQNILIDSDGTAKLADLGLAREAVNEDASVTSPGMTLGTPDYISPEQIRGETDLDGRCDVYSLGATLYHLLTGKPPFRGETANVTMARHLTDLSPDPRSERPDTSASTAAIVRKAMQKDKDRRYSTAEEMLDALEGARRRLAAAEGESLPQTAPPRRAKPGPAKMNRTAVALAAAGLVAAVILLLLLTGGSEPTTTKPRGTVLRPGPDKPAAPPARPDHPQPPTVPGRPDAGLLDEARRLAEKGRDEPWLVIGPLRRRLAQTHGTESEAAVRQILDDTRRRIAVVAEAKLRRLETQTDALCEQKQFGRATALLRSFPARSMPGEWRTRFHKTAKSVTERLHQAENDVKAAAAAAAKAGNYDRAITLLQDITTWGMPKPAADARRQIAAWQDEKARDARRRRDARAALRVEQIQKILSALKGRRYAEARRLAAEAARNKTLRPDAKEFARLAEDAAQLESFWREAEGRIRKLKPGDPVRVGSILRRFVRFERGAVTAKVGELVKTVPLKDLSDVDLFLGLFAERYKTGAGDVVAYWQRGLFYTFDKDRKPEQALKDFAVVEERGKRDLAARGRRYLQIVGHIEAERAALELMTEARAAAKRKQWGVLEARLEKLAELRDTDACRQHADELRELDLLADLRGLPPVPGLVGTYYNGADFGRRKHARIDPTVNVRGRRLRAWAGQGRNFSVRWEGYIEIDQPDRYRFALVADDGFRFWLDDKKLLDEWRIRMRNQAVTEPIPLDKGLHRIRIEFFQAGGLAYLQFRWQHRGVFNALVPPNVLYHSVRQAKKLGAEPRGEDLRDGE